MTSSNEKFSKRWMTSVTQPETHIDTPGFITGIVARRPNCIFTNLKIMYGWKGSFEPKHNNFGDVIITCREWFSFTMFTNKSRATVTSETTVTIYTRSSIMTRVTSTPFKCWKTPITIFITVFISTILFNLSSPRID